MLRIDNKSNDNGKYKDNNKRIRDMGLNQRAQGRKRIKVGKRKKNKKKKKQVEKT